MMENLTLNAALGYAIRNYPIIPLLPNTKIPCKTKDFSNGYHSATTNQDLILEHWNNGKNVSCNIGLQVGKESGLVILDIDVHEENGFESLVVLENHFGKLPPTLEVATPSSGKHYYFKYPANVTIQRQVSAFKGIDVLVDGYVVAPPSVIDGKAYKRISGDLNNLAEFPQWLVEHPAITSNSTDELPSNELKQPLNASNTHGKVKYTAKFLKDMVDGATIGNRNDFLMRFTAKCLALGTDLEVIYTLLLVINDNFINESLDEKEINTIFKSMVNKHLKKKVG